MERKPVQWACLIVIVALASFLRVYQLKDLPAGLFCDEAALGYNAYAIGQSGMDENGVTLPLFVWSFQGYKNPIYIYTGAVVTRLFGLDEFTTRLPAALFGIGGVIAVFLVGRAIFNPWVGLFAAALLSITPWHLHFSRIGFELISFPFLFMVGLVLLVRFTQGKRTFAAALFFMGLCPYAYAIATVFVPLFLIGFGLLFLPELLRRWRETLVAFVVAVVTVAPMGWFYQTHPQATSYFRNTTSIQNVADLQNAARTFGRNYVEFFNPIFLFKNGDSISRHAVRGHGELLPSMLPLLLAGALFCLVRRDRASKLVLWWMAVYPVAPSLMTEVPTASRAIIGAPGFCLVAAVGVAGALYVLQQILRWRPLVLTAQTAGVVAAAYFLGLEFQAYWNTYANEYPKWAAPTYGGFQYGYRDSIKYMESQRGNYDLLMLTAVMVNQPQIFPLFYKPMDPVQWSKGARGPKELGYLILDPAEYSRYSMNQRILYQLNPVDLQMFTDYTIKHRVTAPSGQDEFVIAEVRARKRYLTEWLFLGLFDNSRSEGVTKALIDVQHITKSRYQGAFGDIYWRPFTPQFVRVDLNRAFANADTRNPGNPEEVCAYALLTVKSPQAQEAYLEMGGSEDYAQVWLNGSSLTAGSMTLGPPRRTAIKLSGGDNVLVVKSCEGIGDWYFTARITDADGKDFPNITTSPELPTGPLPVVTRPPSDLPQLVEGLGEMVRFKHTQATYPDYRGGTLSWWAYVVDEGSEVVWRTAPPAAKKRTTFVFTASISNEEGEAEVFVNGEFALTIPMGPHRGMQTWQAGSYRMTFVPKIDAGGNSGVMWLDVPADKITAGQALEIRVAPVRGAEHAWFMIKDYRDSIAHEQITPQSIVDIYEHQWEVHKEG